jgi:uncharacterized sulfatase
LDTLTSQGQGDVDETRTHIFSGRERHSSSRYKNLTYPQRAIRTRQYLYIRNFAPERWPAGAPQKYELDSSLGRMHGGYHDIDSSPSLTFLVENRTDGELRRFLDLAVGKRPAEELFDVTKDPGCLENLAGKSEFEEIRAVLGKQLESYLKESGDPRAHGKGHIFEDYRRYSPIRKFPPPD